VSLTDAIRARLEDGPATETELADHLDRSPSVMRNTLASMYFQGVVGCDTKRRFHLLTGEGLSNGVPVIRHLDGEDVFA
jgi:hypothetical protein